jgi:hypothetical protein
MWLGICAAQSPVDTIEELRAALVEFATRYNETWLVVARHGLVHQPRCEPINAELIRLPYWSCGHIAPCAALRSYLLAIERPSGWLAL